MVIKNNGILFGAANMLANTHCQQYLSTHTQYRGEYQSESGE